MAALDGLGTRVSGLDAQMSNMQAQIMRLEAASNMTSHGLLGKTLDEEEVVPPTRQMRPQSAGANSRRCGSWECGRG